MTTRHLVDPELLPLLELWPTVALSAETLPLLRDNRMPRPETDPAAKAAVTMATHMAPGPAGAPDVGVVVYTPNAGAGPRPCILHLHGGGYVAGTPDMMEAAHYAMAHKLDCVIASVDYRLAPETPFPGPVEDAYAGLAWVMANAARLGVDPARVGVMGESAGGGLAAALALLARDRGEHRLAFQHLIYPMLDDRTCVDPDPNPVAGEFIWTRGNNAFGWASLLGHEPGRAGVSPYAAAARAEDVSGLPPTFIATPTLDLFVDECIIYARRLMRAGVATELHVYPGGFHAFNVLTTARVAQAAQRDSMAALARALHG